jgi:hypothetical protein
LKITRRSTLKHVAAAVAKALGDARVSAVLTGGACATIHSRGAYQSEDLDLVLQSAPSQQTLDAAMASAGFTRKGDTYRHPATRFFVEFPRGPLSIGADLDVAHSSIVVNGVRVTLLSATDACRDRLAAYFHWKDRQSLDTAVAIAVRNRVNLARVKAWSVQEGAATEFDEFAGKVKAARAARRARARRRPAPKS